VGKVSKYRVYFTGYEHPYVKSGYKTVEVDEKVKFAYLKLFNKRIKLPISVWEEMRKGAEEIENVSE
jgi:hypothetical protein